MPPTSLSKDLVAASATPIILSILTQGDSYGYAIIDQVREISGGQMQWADGMLYPILHRLERKELIASYSEKSAAGRKRKYYKILPAGQAELTQQRSDWRRLQNILTRLEEIHV